MKKLLFVFAVAAFASCGNGEAKTEGTDTAAKMEATPVDTAAKTTDTAAKMATDTAAKMATDTAAKAAH